MSTPKLWVWVGSSDDKLDVIRYVTATEQDIIGQTCVRNRIRELEAEVERLRDDREIAVTALREMASGHVFDNEAAADKWYRERGGNALEEMREEH